MTLTVIIRDDSLMMLFGDRPKYRTVCVTLTPEQVALLSLREVGTIGGKPVVEEIADCFLGDAP